jgi:hypothetical protein
MNSKVVTTIPAAASLKLRDISAAARAVVKICEVRRGSVAPAGIYWDLKPLYD